MTRIALALLALALSSPYALAQDDDAEENQEEEVALSRQLAGFHEDLSRTRETINLTKVTGGGITRDQIDFDTAPQRTTPVARSPASPSPPGGRPSPRGWSS